MDNGTSRVPVDHSPPPARFSHRGGWWVRPDRWNGGGRGVSCGDDREDGFRPRFPGTFRKVPARVSYRAALDVPEATARAVSRWLAAHHPRHPPPPAGSHLLVPDTAGGSSWGGRGLIPRKDEDHAHAQEVVPRGAWGGEGFGCAWFALADPDLAKGGFKRVGDEPGGAPRRCAAGLLPGARSTPVSDPGPPPTTPEGSGCWRPPAAS